MVDQSQQQQDSAAAAAAAAAASDQKADRPEGLADDYWNGETNTVQFDKLVPAFNDLRAYKAERDSADAQLPADETGYEVGLPEDFKLPEGMKFEVDADDPLIPVAQKFALDNKLSPAAFKNLVAMRVQAQIAEDAALGAAATAEMEKLGTNAQARTAAITTFLEAKLGNDLANALLPGIFTAKQVQAYERIMQLTKGSGAGAFNGSGREPDAGAEQITDEDWARMTPSDRIKWSREHPQKAA